MQLPLLHTHTRYHTQLLHRRLFAYAMLTVHIDDDCAVYCANDRWILTNFLLWFNFYCLRVHSMRYVTIFLFLSSLNTNVFSIEYDNSKRKVPSIYNEIPNKANEIERRERDSKWAFRQCQFVLHNFDEKKIVFHSYSAAYVSVWYVCLPIIPWYVWCMNAICYSDSVPDRNVVLFLRFK